MKLKPTIKLRPIFDATEHAGDFDLAMERYCSMAEFSHPLEIKGLPHLCEDGLVKSVGFIKDMTAKVCGGISVVALDGEKITQECEFATSAMALQAIKARIDAVAQMQPDFIGVANIYSRSGRLYTKELSDALGSIGPDFIMTKLNATLLSAVEYHVKLADIDEGLLNRVYTLARRREIDTVCISFEGNDWLPSGVFNNLSSMCRSLNQMGVEVVLDYSAYDQTPTPMAGIPARLAKEGAMITLGFNVRSENAIRVWHA